MAISDLCYIDATGFHLPDYETVLSYFKKAYQDIFGTDVYLEPDSQDGQLITILALAVFDTLRLAAADFNSRSPSTAQGAGLSSVVKINGITRKVATRSTVSLTLTGTAQTVITNGSASDSLFQKWNLPSSVTIPDSGMVTVTAIADTLGYVQAAPGTITRIGTPTIGWQTVTNVAAALPGKPIETDAELAARQTISTAIPSLTIMDGILGAVANVPGVEDYYGIDNDGSTADSNGVPAHNIAVIVSGGRTDDAQFVTDIATAIQKKKSPGCGTCLSVTGYVCDLTKYTIASHVVTAYTGTDTHIRIPVGVTGINASVFNGHSELVSVIMPPCVATIGNTAFHNCSSLSSVYFNGPAPTLGTTPFQGCAAGLTIYYLTAAASSFASWSAYTKAIFTLFLSYPPTAITGVDDHAEPWEIGFFRAQPATISVAVTVNPIALSGYNEGYRATIAASIAAAINNLAIGEDISVNNLFEPAMLKTNAIGASYTIPPAGITIAKNGGIPAYVDVPIAPDEIAKCNPLIDVTITDGL